MYTITRPVRLLALVTALAALALACGCGSDTVKPTPTAAAPTLPDPERLVPDLAFFDQGAALSAKEAGAYDNFVNAYLRVVVVDALTHLVLAPPVTAFAVALHTIPSPQPDGSWLWVYTWVNGPEEAQIRLRGHEVGDVVQWELRVTALSNDPAFDNVLWFEGQTARDGAEGTWTFHDPELAGNPAVGELAWGDDDEGAYLTLECISGDDIGDLLTYRHDAPACIVGFHDGGTGHDYDIRWNERDGSGSLLVPDYNGGMRACWDMHQNDSVCP
ncbi:MAG: hypothetical protein IPI48_10005 [bacterium]|nr:hypothetical protein [bacterium]